MTGVLIKTEEKQIHTEEVSSKDWSHAPKSQATPTIANHPQELGEEPGPDAPSQSTNGTNPAGILISDFWPPEL